MAEPAVVTATPLVIGFGERAQLVASAISGRLGTANALGVLVLAGLEEQARHADGDHEVNALRAEWEAGGIPHLTVEWVGDTVWVGPAVIAGHGGCHACWEARRRQHAQTLSQHGADPVAGNPDELMRLAVRACLAVARRVIDAPREEAGAVRRFSLGGGTPTAGRVVPVTGCDRCDPLRPARVGWSLAG